VELPAGRAEGPSFFKAASVPTAGEIIQELQHLDFVWVPSAPETANFRGRREIVKLPRRQFLHLAAGAAVLPVVPRFARAQTYPTRPITMVVPFAAGGATDVIGRIMAERMKSSLGQPVIVENVTGALGTIAVARVARAAPDGYTLSLGNNSSHVMPGATYALQYDLLNDFEPVALISASPYVLVAKKTIPASDLKGLIAWLKANPDKATQAHAGTGGTAHAAGIFFQRETGTRFQFVPYRGGAAPAIQDLMAGHIDMAITDPVAAMPQVRAGTIKAYGVTTSTRLLSAPDIPTLDEAGLPGFDLSLWQGLWVPKGTPNDIIAKLNTAAVEALADPGVQQRLTALGVGIIPRDRQTPEALAAFQKAEIEKWWPIIKAAGIKAE
jgi:tripartite-type tricarboxylate transporter receptor subunit TctC